MRTIFFNITHNGVQHVLFLRGDPGREMLDPALLGEIVKIEQGSILLNQIFNLIARYVRKVCADEHIRRAIHYSAGRSFLDVIGPSDIQEQQGHVGSGHTSARVGGRGYGKSRKEIKLLFTSGRGQKRTQGNSLWNLEGMKCFH
jgi:hypothetical protein